MGMRRAFRYPLMPTVLQAFLLVRMLATHRHVYNEALDQREGAYRRNRMSVTYSDQSAWLKILRLESGWARACNFSSLQATLRRLDKAFQAFFRRLKAGQKPGYPRYKGHDRFNCIEFPTPGDGIKLLEDGFKVRIKNIGTVKVRRYRAIEGEVKTVSLVRDDDKWFLVVSCDLGAAPAVCSTNPPVGIDMGLTTFAMTDQGEAIPNPRFFKKAKPIIRRASRRLERRTKRDENHKLVGRQSKRRNKAKRELRKVHRKVREQRRDFVHKEARKIVSRFGLIAMEDLSIGNMLRNHRLAGSISDASWGAFKGAVRHGAEGAGVAFVGVDPRGTSQDCSGCGKEVRKGLKVRVHACPHCGLVLDRDVNAARNIMSRALARTVPAGGVDNADNLGLLRGDMVRPPLPRGCLGSPRL